MPTSGYILQTDDNTKNHACLCCSEPSGYKSHGNWTGNRTGKHFIGARAHWQVIEAGAKVFEGQAGLGVPQGLARFCSGPVWAEAALLTSLYQAACSRYSAAYWNCLCFPESSSCATCQNPPCNVLCRAIQDDSGSTWRCKVFVVHPQARCAARWHSAGRHHMMSTRLQPRWSSWHMMMCIAHTVLSWEWSPHLVVRGCWTAAADFLQRSQQG